MRPADTRPWGGDAPMSAIVMALAFRTWADGTKVGYAFSPERISVQLRDDPTVGRVVLSDPWRSHLSRLARRGADAPAYSTDASRSHVQPHRWRRSDPTDLDGAVREARRLDRWLRARAGAADPDGVVLATSDPVLAAVADRAAWRDVTYYAWDDFRGVPGMREVFDWAHGRIAERDVNVVAVTPRIVEVVGAPRSTVVPNAILASDFEDPVPVPAWFAALPGRVAFYAGSLQNRVDVGLLRDLARDLGAGWTLALVGPMQDPDWFAALAEEPNVVVHGAEPRPAVLAMMAAADVCLVPHVAGTEDMSPLKVYEYLGAGAAVVATDLEPMRGLSPRCLLVPAGASLTAAVREAADLPPATSAEVADFRARHDWSARYAAWRRAVLGY